MIRVAMISFWHVHARDYAREATAHPETEIVAAWDELPERGRAAAESLGARFYTSLDELLAQPDIDAVIIDTPTNMHPEVMVAAARAGKHIFTEKVLALTLHECRQILDAVEQAGVVLTVSLPRLNAGYTLAIQDILARGWLGELTLVRTRLSHNGAIGQGWLPAHFYNPEQTGGGALVDLGCHPMYLARLFLGLPESVSANYGYLTGRVVEDNAVAVLRYPQGALGVVEAGFVNRFSPFTIELHGTEGSLFYGTPDSTLRIRSAVSGAPGGGEQWETLPQPQDRPAAFQQWVTHIQQGTSATENIQTAVDLTILMEAANLSARSNQPVRLDTLAV
ncbi:MAG TPA: Gfo/Idh/MocA family oxidoreductase [Ktedonosporobacter sp.]|nr:Gfo/Idh/MocA family oxidoreductase [Ktedonosporobacter sp.]